MPDTPVDTSLSDEELLAKLDAEQAAKRNAKRRRRRRIFLPILLLLAIASAVDVLSRCVEIACAGSAELPG